MGAVPDLKKVKLIFMGTPDFAVPSLEALIAAGCNITAVITQPDRPKGRGRRDAPSPVKEAAERHAISPVLQPERVRDEKFLAEFFSLAPEVVALVAFGQILPREMLELPKYGIVNVHPSLLPKYRGAAPINWALIRGETETGVTTMRIGEGVDSGDILLQEKVLIAPEEDHGSLSARLAALGAQLLVKTLERLVSGNLEAIPQDHSRATLAPRLRKEDGQIKWDSRPQDIVNLVRGLSPSPAAYSFLQGKQLKVFSAKALPGSPDGSPGRILGMAEDGLLVSAREGVVALREIQLEGKKRMPARDFIRGRDVTGEVLS